MPVCITNYCIVYDVHSAVVGCGSNLSRGQAHSAETSDS